jgi:hypothetical protein
MDGVAVFQEIQFGGLFNQRVPVVLGQQLLETWPFHCLVLTDGVGEQLVVPLGVS